MADLQGTPPFRLSRDLLRQHGLAAMLQRGSPGFRVVSEAELQASLANTMAAHPCPQEGVWVFAYGSLLWNPTVHVAERCRARVEGWHRAFCLTASAVRGTPSAPGLLLALREGEACDGVALKIAPDNLAEDLDLLWRREMVFRCYVARWLRIAEPEPGAPSHALAFTIDPTDPAYAGDLPEAEVVRRIATARGELGSCAEYLYHTHDALRLAGIRDKAIERLVARVRAHHTG